MKYLFKIFCLSACSLLCLGALQADSTDDLLDDLFTESQPEEQKAHPSEEAKEHLPSEEPEPLPAREPEVPSTPIAPPPPPPHKTSFTEPKHSTDEPRFSGAKAHSEEVEEDLPELFVHEDSVTGWQKLHEEAEALHHEAEEYFNRGNIYYYRHQYDVASSYFENSRDLYYDAYKLYSEALPLFDDIDFRENPLAFTEYKHILGKQHEASVDMKEASDILSLCVEHRRTLHGY